MDQIVTDLSAEVDDVVATEAAVLAVVTKNAADITSLGNQITLLTQQLASAGQIPDADALQLASLSAKLKTANDALKGALPAEPDAPKTVA